MYFLFGEVRVTVQLSWRLAWCSKQWILMLSLRLPPGRSKFLDLFSKACNLRHMQSESHPIPALS